MSSIHFKSMFIRNFMSVGDNGLCIQLDTHPTILVTGNNGAGKSVTGPESICFVLFGKSYRGVNKGALISTINQRDSVVEIEFSKGSDEWKIIRGQKPNRLEIYKNGVALNEEAALKDTQSYIERDILGFDYSAFTKVCIISTTNYVPFVQLSAGERRTFVETILSMSEFAEMAKAHRAKVSLLRDMISRNSNDLDKKKVEYTELTKSKQRVEELSSDISAKFMAEAKASGLKAAEKKAEIAELKTKLEALDKASAVASRQRIVAELSIHTNQNSGYTHKISQLQSQIDFFKDHGECPTCDQAIHHDHADYKVKDFQSEIDTLTESMNENKTSIDDLNIEKGKLDAIVHEAGQLENAIHMANSAYTFLLTDAKEKAAKAQQSAVTSNTADIDTQIDQVKGELKVLADQMRSLEEQRKVYAVVTDLLKDTGIKSSIIEKYIPILVAYVNMYLTKLGYNVTFDMDLDFKETIKTRFANEHTFENLSMGERLRISLAITLAWNQIAKLRGNIDTNLIILDEVLDSSLDATGSEDLFELIEDVFSNKNVWIISHKPNFHEKVYRHIHLEKKDGFTKILFDRV